MLTLPTWLAWQARPNEGQLLAWHPKEERWWLWLMAFLSTLVVIAILDPIAKFPSSAVVLATTSLIALRLDRLATSVAIKVTILTAMASLILSRELDLADNVKLMTWASYVQITGLLCLLTGMTTAMVRETNLLSNLRLNEQNELIRRILAQSSDVIISLDRDHRYRIVNEAAGEVVGRPAAEVIGRTIEELCPPAEAARIRKIDAEVMERGVALVLEESVMTPTGEKTFLSTKAPLRSGDGSVIGMLGVCHDVTALKKVETELRRNLRRLRELTEWAPVAIAEFDRDRTCVYTNPAMQRLLKLSSDEARGGGWQRA